jgi:lipopolysaccharide export system protein LptA
MWKDFSVILPGTQRINLIFPNISAWIILALIWSLTTHAMAQTGSGVDADIADKELRITADMLVSDGNANYILFSGNVITIYEDTTIVSDQMKVFYENMKEDQNRMGEENIQKIVATGHVSIRFGDRTARCDQAVYTAKTKTIVLTGEDTRIQSGTDYISGKKITIDQNNDRITVDGSPDKRVNAVFAPQQKTETIDPGGNKDHDDSGSE